MLLSVCVWVVVVMWCFTYPLYCLMMNCQSQLWLLSEDNLQCVLDCCHELLICKIKTRESRIEVSQDHKAGELYCHLSHNMQQEGCHNKSSKSTWPLKHNFSSTISPPVIWTIIFLEVSKISQIAIVIPPPLPQNHGPCHTQNPLFSQILVIQNRLAFSSTIKSQRQALHTNITLGNNKQRQGKERHWCFEDQALVVGEMQNHFNHPLYLFMHFPDPCSPSVKLKTIQKDQHIRLNSQVVWSFTQHLGCSLVSAYPFLNIDIHSQKPLSSFPFSAVTWTGCKEEKHILIKQ